MDGDKAVDNEKELTSTSCGSQSPKPASTTNKEEKTDSNDTLPTSSTDASTFLKLNSSVSDDPISSTSEMNPSNPNSDKKHIDELNKASVSYDNEELMLLSMTQSEKVEENVDDLVNDLETLLGETAPSFDLPGKSNIKSKEKVTIEELEDFLVEKGDNEVSSNTDATKKTDVERLEDKCSQSKSAESTKTNVEDLDKSDVNVERGEIGDKSSKELAEPVQETSDRCEEKTDNSEVIRDKSAVGLEVVDIPQELCQNVVDEVPTQSSEQTKEECAHAFNKLEEVSKEELDDAECQDASPNRDESVKDGLNIVEHCGSADEPILTTNEAEKSNTFECEIKGDEGSKQQENNAQPIEDISVDVGNSQCESLQAEKDCQDSIEPVNQNTQLSEEIVKIDEVPNVELSESVDDTDEKIENPKVHIAEADQSETKTIGNIESVTPTEKNVDCSVANKDEENRILIHKSSEITTTEESSASTSVAGFSAVVHKSGCIQMEQSISQEVDKDSLKEKDTLHDQIEAKVSEESSIFIEDVPEESAQENQCKQGTIDVPIENISQELPQNASAEAFSPDNLLEVPNKVEDIVSAQSKKDKLDDEIKDDENDKEEEDVDFHSCDEEMLEESNSELLDSKEGDIEDNEPNEGSSGSEATKIVDTPEPSTQLSANETVTQIVDQSNISETREVTTSSCKESLTETLSETTGDINEEKSIKTLDTEESKERSPIQAISVATVEDISETMNTEPVDTEESIQESSIQTVSSPKAEVVESVETDESQKIPFSDEGFVKETVFEDLNETKTEESADLVPCELTVDEVGEAEASEPAEMEEPIKESVIENVSEASKPINTLSEESLPSSTIGGEELCEITAGKTVLTDEPIEESIMEAISEPAAEHLSESVKINEDGATPEPTTLDSTTKDDPANDESSIATTSIKLVHLQEPEIDEPTEIEEPMNETISEVIQPEQLENSSSNAEIESNKLQERDDSEVLIDKTKNLSKRSEPLPEDVPSKSPVLDAIPVCNVSEESPDLDAEEKSKIGPEIVNKDADFEASEDLVQTKTSTDAEPVTLKPEAVMVIKKEIKPAGSEIEPNLRVADTAESEVVEETMQPEEGVVESQSHSLEESHNKTQSIACPIKASEVSQENVIQDDNAVVETCEAKKEIETEGSTSERILESRESHEVSHETEITEIVDKEEEMAELQLSEDENTTDDINNPIPEVNIRRKTVEQDLEKVVCLSEESSDSDTNASAAPTAPTTTDDQSPFDGEANLIIAAEEAEQLDKETDVPIPVVEDLPNETAALESSNLETIMAVASLQQDTVPSISSERRLSEKEIREMEAIRMAVASITDSSQDTYDSYMVDNSLMMDAIPEVDNVESGMGNELAVDEETTTEVNDDRMDEVYDEIPAALENNDDLQVEPKDEQDKQASLNYILTDAPKMEEVIENVDKTPEATESIKLAIGIESHINDNSKESSSSEIVKEDCEETAEEIVLKDDESLNQQGVEKTNYEKDSEKLLEAESSKEVEYAGSKEHLEGSHATVKDKTDIAVPKIDQCEQKEEQAVNTERDSKTEANEGNKFNVLEQESEILNPTEHVQEKEETLKITKSAEVVKESIECPEPTKIEIFAKVADEPKTNTIEDIQIAEGSKEHKGHTSDLIAHSLKKVDECEDAQVDKDIMEELKIAKDKMKVNRKQRAAKPEETYAESHSSKEIEKKEDEVPNNVCKSMEKEVSEGPQEVAEDISEEQTTNAEKGEDEKPLRSRLRRGGTGKVSEPLSITVDEGEKEKVYSPKITIKPIKTVDEEVSTTSDADANKGSLKMTITKQADKLHSILKVYNPEDDTAPVQGQEEPIPKLIIKPKIQQVEQQHSPKMSTRSSRTYSPTGTRCSSPRVTIKPIPKAPEAKAEASSPIKITFKPVVKPEDSIKRHSPKLSKENDQKNQSPKITIKPIPKPADEELSVATPKVTIKPIKRPLEDPDSEGRASPKIIIKPVVKPTEQDQPEQAMPKLKIKAIRRQNEENELEKDQGSPRISIKTVKPPEDEAPEDEVKERIVLKINKGNLPTPSKDSKKREYPEDDKAEKTGIKLKFSTTGGHTHIVQENEDSNKRQRKDSGYSGKDLEENTSHKRALEEKLPERNKRLKHTPDKFNDSSNVKMDETRVNSPVSGGDSRSQHSDVTPDEFSRISKIADIASRTTHIEAVPQEITVGVVTPTQSPVPKKRPGRPRKIPLTPKEGMETPPLTPQSQLGVEQIATPPTSDVGTPEATPSPGGRPKRSCRTTNVIAALGIKPKRSRGGRGGGRGSKVNMGDREPPPTPEQLPKPEKPEKAKKDVEKKSEVTDTSKLIVEGPVEEQNTPNNGDSETPNTSSKSVTDSVKTEKKELTKQDVPSIKLEESDDKLKDDNDKQKESSDLQSKPGGTVEEEAPIKKKKEDKTPPRKLEVTTRRQKAQLEKEAEAAKLKENPRVETRRSQQKKDETPKVELRRTSVSPKGNPKKTTTVVEPISDTTPPKVGKGNPKKLDNTASPQTDTPLSRKGVGKRTQSTEYVVEADDSPGKSIKVPAKKTLNIESPATVGKVATRKSPSVEGPIQHSLSSPKKTVPEESKNPISAEKGPITRRKSLCIEPVASTSKTPVTTVEDVIIISTDEDDSCGKEDLEDKGEETVPVPNESVIKHSLAVEISDKPTRPKEKTSTPKKVVEKHNEPSVPENVPKPVVVETRRQSKSVEKKETEEIIGEDPLKITIEDQTRALKLKEEFTKPKKEVIDEAVEITELKNEPKVELKFEEAEDSDDEDKKEEDSDSDDSETEKRNAWVLMRKREAIVKCRAKRMEKLAKIAEQKKKRLEQVAQQREARKAVEEAEKLTQNRATKRYGRYGAPKPQISLIDEPVIEIEGTIKSAIGLFDPVTKKIGVFEPIDDDDTEKSPERPLTKTHFSVPEPMVVDSADNSPTKHGRSLTDEDVVMLDEDTQMSADFRQSAPGTPAKQSNNPSDIVEDSQGSLGTEGGKSRSSKGPPKMEVFQDLEQAFTGDQLAEYSWNGQGPFMLQEQVTQFLGIKSFKRKYPNIPRRPVDMQERDYLKENAMVTEAQCDLGLTAVIAQDILDIMYLDFQDKYEEYCRCQREKQARELANKQKALSLTALKPGFDKLDLLEQAIQSAASWNQQLNKSRREERRTHMDLQTFTIHYPKSKMKVVSAPKIGHYPVALVPGQFTDYYHEYTPTELNNLPINTMCYDEIKPYIESEDSGSSSDSESESDSDSSSSSSSCDDKDCKDCQRDEGTEGNETKETDSDVVFIDNDASSSDSVVLVSVTAPPAAVSA